MTPDDYDLDEPDQPLADEFADLPVTGWDESTPQPEQGDTQDDGALAPGPGKPQVLEPGTPDAADDPDPDDYEPDGDTRPEPGDPVRAGERIGSVSDVPRDERPDEQEVDDAEHR